MIRYAIMVTLRPHQNLVVWQEAYKLCLLVYKATKTFPIDERFGLISQMRNCSSSISANIAEGNARRTNPQKLHFIEIAQGSLEELHTHALLSHDLGYLNTSSFEEINDGIHRTSYLLNKLRSSL